MKIKDKLKALQFSADTYNELIRNEDMNLSEITLGLSIEVLGEYIQECVMSNDTEQVKKQLKNIIIPVYKLWLKYE